MKRFLTFIILISVLSFPVYAEEVKKGLAPICTQCNMAISDKNIKFSVADTKSLQKVMFDDIGCALLWRDQQCATMQDSFDSNAVTYDYYTAEAIKMSDAFFVIDSGVNTPMGYGILAFKSKDEAERFLKESRKGKILNYQELLTIKLKTMD